MVFSFLMQLDQLLRAPPHEANNRKGGLPMETPLSPTDEPPQRSMDAHPLDEQLKEALREISDLKSKNAKLADDLTEAEMEIRDLKNEHSTVQDALKNTSEQLTATMNELQNSKKENERLVEEVTALKKRLENTEEENKRLLAEVASFNPAQTTFNGSKDVTPFSCGQVADPPADSGQPASLPFPSLKMIKCPRCHEEFTRKLVGPHIKNCKGPRKAEPTQKQQVISPEHNRHEHLNIQVTCENSVETTESCPMEWQAAMLQNKEEDGCEVSETGVRDSQLPRPAWKTF
ncbi:hypothetical protein V5799_028742 [Amblyomma americanum]|uniref:Uncharacterized protein n=1 Tax=Amblyomma americanum TaxID=6943 RepID=A0AAQ4DBZ4_AMBAM